MLYEAYRQIHFKIIMDGSSSSITIVPLQYADIDECARITATAFSTDRHTIVKQLGEKPFNMFEVSRDGFRASLSKTTCVHVKAVNQKGHIVGHAGWGFRGIEENKIPWRHPDDEPPADQIRIIPEGRTHNESSNNKDQSSAAKETNEMGQIDHLHALEDADMVSTMNEIMPPGTSCMYITGLIVAPQYQSRGVGGALIEHGNSIADRLNIFTWVHSSDQAWRAYRKFGFEIFKELSLDLDKYAPSRPGKEWMTKLEGTGEGVTEEKWGSYVIRYMKRHPKFHDE